MNYMMEMMMMMTMMKISMPLANMKTHYHSKSVIFEDATKLYSNFTCNPFELGELTRINDTSVRFDPRIIADTKLLESNGEQQFNTFWNDRLIYSKAPVSDTITKNNFCLMGNAAITSLPKYPTLTW